MVHNPGGDDCILGGQGTLQVRYEYITTLDFSMHEFLHRFSCIFRPVAVEIVGADGADGLRTWSRMNFVVKT